MLKYIFISIYVHISHIKVFKYDKETRTTQTRRTGHQVHELETFVLRCTLRLNWACLAWKRRLRGDLVMYTNI